jgi:hypothetical protein
MVFFLSNMKINDTATQHAAAVRMRVTDGTAQPERKFQSEDEFVGAPVEQSGQEAPKRGFLLSVVGE